MVTLQGVEQSTANIMYFSLAEKLYPNSGYNSETGGYLQNLRNSTNIQKVRQYHKDFYRSHFTTYLPLYFKLSLTKNLSHVHPC